MPELTVESLLHHRAEELREIKDRVIGAVGTVWPGLVIARPWLMRQLIDDLMRKIREAEEMYEAF